jgi:hypothetical protein
MSLSQPIRPSSFLEPSSKVLVDLFTDGRYLVPDYQRDYSWTRDEIRDLWEDILSLAKGAFTAHGQMSNPTPHFLGAIVLQSFPDQESRRFEVMDGQQRLVTISVLLNVLFEFTQQLLQKGDRDKWGASLKEMLVMHRAGESVPRLELSRDNKHYQELICKRFTQLERLEYLNSISIPRNSVVGRLKDCIDFFYDQLSQYLGSTISEERDSRLINFIIALLQLTIVLQMKVLEQGVAYEVFESLNARGLDLQQADLLKNKLFSLAEQQRTKDEVSQSWERIVRAVEQQSMLTLTEFFYFHYVSKIGDCKQSDLYKQVFAYLTSPGKNAKAYAEDAEKSAESLQQILEAGTSFAPSVARDIESIKDLITNKYALSLFIAGASRYQQNSTELAEIIRLTHHYVFRRFLVEGVPLSAYSQEITKCARELANGTLADVDALRNRLNLYSNQKIFEEKFKSFSAKSNKIGFYVIEMIENHLTNQAGMMVQRQSVSQHLEHVMPKRPNNDWIHISADPTYADHLNLIGNLLVLEADKNSHIKNKAFSYKNSNSANKDYQNSKLTLPPSVANYLKNGLWTFESIKERQADLVIKYASSVWAL